MEGVWNLHTLYTLLFLTRGMVVAYFIYIIVYFSQLYKRTVPFCRLENMQREVI